MHLCLIGYDQILPRVLCGFAAAQDLRLVGRVMGKIFRT